MGKHKKSLINFNPRSHEGSDAGEGVASWVEDKFQSTLPRGERLVITCTTTKQYIFQSTLPRGERLFPGNLSKYPIRISIHAPTRGATKVYNQNGLIFQFQSTLPRGERLMLRKIRWLVAYFNPRSHEGSDDCLILHGGYDCLFQSTLPRGERH